MKTNKDLMTVNRDFNCKGCGACCKIDGFIHVNKTDLKRFAAHFKMKDHEFKAKYVRWESGMGRVLIGGKEGPCAFLEGGRCTAYEARPLQCRTFPYWDMLTSDKDEWEEAKGYCPGCKEMGEIIVKK